MTRQSRHERRDILRPSKRLYSYRPDGSVDMRLLTTHSTQMVIYGYYGTYINSKKYNSQHITAHSM